DGTLDATFGIGGKVTTDIAGRYDAVYSVALQADGKIVAAGQARRKGFDFLLLRYNSNGTLEPTFGTGGKVPTDLADLTGLAFSSESASSVALQADGKIVAAGRIWNGSNYDWALARYNSNGTLDTSFGTGGKVTTDFLGDDDEAFAVAVQPDGKAVVVGAAFSNDAWAYLFAMARYN